MTEKTDRPSPVRVEGRYFKAEPINPYDWLTFKERFPDIVGRYRIPLSRIVERKRDLEDYPSRKNITLIDLIERNINPTEPYLPISQLAASLGLSRAGIFLLTEATVALISQETGVPLSYAQGKGVGREVERISRIVERSGKLQEFLTRGNPTVIESRAIRLFLEGEYTPSIASRLNEEMALTPSLNGAMIWDILRQAEGRVDYQHLSRLTKRSRKAREALDREASGQWVNTKAQLTEQVLYFLNQGYSRDAIMEEAGISRNQYSALISEAFTELKTDSRLWGEFRRQIINSGVMSEIKFDAMNRGSLNLAAQYLISPYRIYRQKLGETMTGAILSAARPSSRERAILEALTQGLNDSQLARIFSLNRSYMEHIADILSGYSDNSRTVSDRLKERQKIYELFKSDLELGNREDLPKQLQGIPLIEILGQLASGKKYKEILDSIFEQTGVKISPATVYGAYVKLRARYKDKI